MTPPAVRDNQSPLEAALLDVHATLTDLLVAADEQYEAVVAHDRDRIESVTRRQERLSARLAHAEARRVEAQGGASFAQALTRFSGRDAARLEEVRSSVAEAVQELRWRQARTASLLEKSIELTNQTLGFLHRLVTPAAASYDLRGMKPARASVLVDSRA